MTARGFRLSLDILTGEFQRQMEAQKTPIAKAATGAMDSALDIIKSKGRSSIASAGFSKRWQNALRVERYPRGSRISLTPAGLMFHNIAYAGVFEDGATIQGKPLLWLPLPSTPKVVGSAKVSPKRLLPHIESGFVPMKSKKGTPLLGAVVKLSRSQAANPSPEISITDLKMGRSKASGVLRTVPLFFGVRNTTIGKKFSIRQICADAVAQLPRLYAEAFNED